jgi:hypothetical protein
MEIAVRPCPCLQVASRDIRVMLFQPDMLPPRACPLRTSPTAWAWVTLSVGVARPATVETAARADLVNEGGQMTTDQLNRKLDEIELALLREDPSFCRRWSAWQRSRAVHALAVLLLLVAGAALLTTGLAVQSAPTWWAGAAALVLAFGVDRGYQRALRGRSVRGGGQVLMRSVS